MSKCALGVLQVKPDSPGLLEGFFKLSEHDFDDCDLLLVIGISRVVQPFASLNGENLVPICCFASPSWQVATCLGTVFGKACAPYAAQREVEHAIEAWQALRTGDTGAVQRVWAAATYKVLTYLHMHRKHAWASPLSPPCPALTAVYSVEERPVA